MEEMDFERFAKWKCLYCGSRKKDVADITGKDGQILCRVVTCCHCCHTDKYAKTARAAAGFLLDNSVMIREGMTPVPTHLNKVPPMKERKETLDYVINPIQTDI